VKKQKKFNPIQVTPQPRPVKKQDSRLLFLLILSIFIYFNTCFNEYALDDYLVISKNEYTQKGIEGIPDLVTKTSFYGFFKNNNEEVTLRYRPLVMVSYAIECSLFKNRDVLLFFSHFFNILLFALTSWVVYRLTSEFFFRKSPDTAFLATLLFVIHPIHTESVANIKGRDELMSFLFAILAAYLFFRSLEDKRKGSYILSVICFAAGLFSKEGTIAFLAAIPCMLWFFSSLKPQRWPVKMLPFALVAVIYVVIRYSVTGWSHPPSTELLNNPFMGATAEQKAATILLSMGYYLKLLFIPHPLSYDYTFNEITLVTFGDYRVWLSLVLHSLLAGIAIYGVRDKSPVSFAVFFYIITIFLVTNILFNLGAFIGERLLYTPSFGFCVGAAYLMINLFSFVQKRMPAAANGIGLCFIGILTLSAAAKVVTRNAHWKNNFTLMTRDAMVSTESMKANDACAVTLILETDKPGMTEEKKKELLHKAIYHDHKASEIMPSFTDIYLNLGVAYSRLENADSAEHYWNIARRQRPGDAKLKEYDPVLGQLFLKRGLAHAVNKNMDSSLADLEKATRYAPRNTDSWYNYGGALYSTGKLREAKHAFMKVLEIDPSHQQARQGFSSISGHVNADSSR